MGYGLPRIGKRISRDGSRIEWNLESSPARISLFNTKGKEVEYISGAIPESELRWKLWAWQRRHPDQLKMLI